jgi:hypothetical protein
LPVLAAAAAAPRGPSLALEVALASSSVPEAAQARLLARARARGHLPVIVSLVVALPAGRHEPTSAEIAAAQARLLADLGVAAAGDGGLVGPGVGNVKLFEGIPYLALTASPAALERLLGHPLVESVREDAAAAPQ